MAIKIYLTLGHSWCIVSLIIIRLSKSFGDMSLNLLIRSIKKAALVLLSSALVYGMIAPVIFASLVHADPTNLIANPLVETPNSSNSSEPADWQLGNWGTNTITSALI
jgi:hypothetical protein